MHEFRLCDVYKLVSAIGTLVWAQEYAVQNWCCYKTLFTCTSCVHLIKNICFTMHTWAALLRCRTSFSRIFKIPPSISLCWILDFEKLENSPQTELREDSGNHRETRLTPNQWRRYTCVCPKRSHNLKAPGRFHFDFWWIAPFESTKKLITISQGKKRSLRACSMRVLTIQYLLYTLSYSNVHFFVIFALAHPLGFDHTCFRETENIKTAL